MGRIESPFEHAGQGESLSERRLALPGGLVDAGGRVYRHVRVRELTGADEEALFARPSPCSAERVSAFLARAIECIEGLDAPVDVDLASQLQVGDRDYLLLRLRQLDLGDAVHQTMRCPSCSERVDVDLSISELAVRRQAVPQAQWRIQLAGFVLTVRLPTGADQAVVEGLALSNTAAANTRLFSRLVLDIDGHGPPDEEQVRAWPVSLRSQLAAWIDAHAPGPDLFLDLACPHCRSDMSYAFDLPAFFLPSV